MSDLEKLQQFEGRKVRSVWVETEEEWYFSVVDVCWILADSKDYQTARKYWNKLKERLRAEGGEPVTICHQLKMLAQDGKFRLTDVAKMEQLFRIIQSIPSKKAEPFKQWLASVGAERINQMIDPEQSIEQAIADYRRLGYSESWINQRIKTIEVRKGLTDEWKRGGVTREVDFALLTDLMSKTWSGLTTREYKKFKGLTKENLRDNMSNIELLLNALAEESATTISKEKNPSGFVENASAAHDGAEVARGAREDLERRIGHSVITPEKAIDHVTSVDELPFEKDRQISRGNETF